VSKGRGGWSKVLCSQSSRIGQESHPIQCIIPHHETGQLLAGVTCLTGSGSSVRNIESLKLSSTYDCGYVALLGMMVDCSSDGHLGSAYLLSHPIREQVPLYIYHNG